MYSVMAPAPLSAPFSALAQPLSFQKEAIVLRAQLPGFAGVPTLVQRLAEAFRLVHVSQVERAGLTGTHGHPRLRSDVRRGLHTL
jgi:hypothetical protein